VQTTNVVDGVNPEWNQTFTFEAKASATLKVVISRLSMSKPGTTKRIAKLSGTAIPPACSERDIETTYDLRLFARRAKLVIRWSLAPDEATLTTEAVPQNSGISEGVTFPPDVVGSATADGVVEPTLQQLQQIVAAVAPASMDATSPFVVVMGYVKKFVDIGTIITEAHPYAKLAWSVLTTWQKVVIILLPPQ